MASAADQKFGLLVKASFRKAVEDDKSITPELLKDELYSTDGDMSVAAVRSALGTVSNVLRQAAYEDELSNETLQRAKTLTETQQQIVMRFWQSYGREAARKAVTEKSRVFQNRLTSFQWRVDSRSVGDKQESTAIVEMVIGGNTVHFEMDEAQMRDVLATMDDLKQVLHEKSGQ